MILRNAFLVIFLTLPLSTLADAKTVKLLCENTVIGGSAGPLELDLENHVAYRYLQREPWQITGLQEQFVTFEKLMDTGGEIAVLNTTTGILESASIGLRCNAGVIPCTAALAHLQNSSYVAQQCSKSLLAD